MDKKQTAKEAKRKKEVKKDQAPPNEKNEGEDA